MTPIVAIVGRPNVGKSTLFNRLAGKQLAIVHDAPGVTRDRNYADAHLRGRDLTLIDTGGFDPTTEDPMGQGIARQVSAAIEQADVVVCVLDASGPPTGADRDSVELLRRSGKPVVYVANKADDDRRRLEAADHYALGVDEIVPISALHGRGIADLEARITAALPPFTTAAELEATDDAPRVALVGRPHAGKSSLVNKLIGSERSLVADEPGTTRDPVDTRLSYGDRQYLLVDTAGIRRRTRVERGVEAASVMRSIRAVGRAQVVVLMCEVTGGIAEQDARLLRLCTERGRAVVVGLNKADLLGRAERRAAEQNARDALHFAPWAPIVAISAKTGFGLDTLMQTVAKAADEFTRRVPTGELNRFFEQVLQHRAPPTAHGRAPRIYYITQAQTAPPVFVAMSSAPEYIQEGYKRFVANQIRKSFGFECVPVQVVFRKRARKEK